MTWIITDYDELLILFDNGFNEIYVPKFRMRMAVNEPYVYIDFTFVENGGKLERNTLTVDYADVELGYGGPTPSSAAELLSVLEGYQVSAFSGGTVTVDILSPLMLMGG